ncbi:hypothetical protein, partial [Clostridium perfringens]
MLGVVTARLFAVLARVTCMPASSRCVVAGLLVVSCLVLLGSRPVMLRGMLVVLSGRAMMFRALMFS